MTNHRLIFLSFLAMHTASCAGAAAYGNRSHRTPINAAEAASSQDFKATLTQTVGSAPINVKDFGAKANPLFDDHSYIQAAFEAAIQFKEPVLHHFQPPVETRFGASHSMGRRHWPDTVLQSAAPEDSTREASAARRLRAPSPGGA